MFAGEGAPCARRCYPYGAGALPAILDGFSRGSEAVRQLPESRVERRREPRAPRAFAFWVRPVGSHNRVSAWMLDVSTRGAAFLTAAEEAPRVGERIELEEMLTTDRMVREGADALPGHARVVRHDPSEGITQRVAVQFEADAQEPLGGGREKLVAASLPLARAAAVPPPLPLAPSRIVLPCPPRA